MMIKKKIVYGSVFAALVACGFLVGAILNGGGIFKALGDVGVGDYSVKETIKAFFVGVDHVWNYKITTLEKQPIAVSNVIIGVVLFIIGLWVARYLSRFINRKLLTILEIDKSVADALEKFSYYLFLIINTLIVLDISNVPLKVFTFVGGALAIGIGFGSQNIISNFISGLILMVERPIKVGDLIEVNTMLGRVISIGARCTHIRTGSSVDILLPNSSMLENKVVNWTLTDNIVRVNIAIGVAYNTPTHKVETLLLKAVKQTSDILSSPAPQVYFTNFGESSLQFEAHFWIELSSPIEKIRIISNLNHLLDELFRENQISFAYPQREMHIVSDAPIQVKML